MADRATACRAGRGCRTSPCVPLRPGRRTAGRTVGTGHGAAARPDHEAEDLAVHRRCRHRRAGTGRRGGDRRRSLGLHGSAYGRAGPGRRPRAPGWHRSRPRIRGLRYVVRFAPPRAQRRGRTGRSRRHLRPGGIKAAPGDQDLADLLDPLLKDAPGLGGRRAAAVVDLTTGKRLYGLGSDAPLTPASTTKIATAVAALTALGPDHRLTTRTALEADTGEVVLVGGGDPTLTAREDARGLASLRTLAGKTAAALKKRGVREVTLSYDTTLYAGTEMHPIGVNENLARVTALMADEGRTDDSTSGPAPACPTRPPTPPAPSPAS